MSTASFDVSYIDRSNLPRKSEKERGKADTKLIIHFPITNFLHNSSDERSRNFIVN